MGDLPDLVGLVILLLLLGSVGQPDPLRVPPSFSGLLTGFWSRILSPVHFLEFLHKIMLGPPDWSGLLGT